MKAPLNHDEICKELSGELEDMAKWLTSGNLSPGQFRSLMNTLEKKKLEHFGMKLSSTVSIDGVVHFSLRFAETNELCATMDVDPITGKLSTQLECAKESCLPDFMNKNNPKTRTEAAAPEATKHLAENQKRSLDLQADAEHAGVLEREKLTRRIEELGNSVKPAVKRPRTNQSR